MEGFGVNGCMSTGNIRVEKQNEYLGTMQCVEEEEEKKANDSEMTEVSPEMTKTSNVKCQKF